MNSKIFSCSFSGLNCHIIEVQADVSNGLPQFSIVGLGDTSVKESRERVRSSIKNSGAIFPAKRKTVNLAPAELRKQGSLFDLPIAISILIASDQVSTTHLQNSIIIGELSLSGKVRAVKGVLAITQHAQQQGFTKIFLPQENASEASFVEGIKVHPLKSLKELINICSGQVQPQLQTALKWQRNPQPITDFQNIIGLETAKRGLLLAASGGHNILLHGAPGCGKTILARAFQQLLPPMQKAEILESSKIYSICGLLEKQNPLIMQRPFREVHHSSSMISIIGGGAKNPSPGEISLAHNGVLFFDEISEFPRAVLESLRQPLEDKFIRIARSGFSSKFPCNFIFIATTNPCPCGYHGDSNKCICSDHQVRTYQKKLSGPIQDRFDILLKIPRRPMKKIFATTTNNSQALSKKINNAHKTQTKRFQNHPTIYKNSDMKLPEIKKFCRLNISNENFLQNAVETLALSNRAHLKILKLARTIADLEGSAQILELHLAEAIQYRKKML